MNVEKSFEVCHITFCLKIIPVKRKVNVGFSFPFFNSSNECLLFFFCFSWKLLLDDINVDTANFAVVENRHIWCIGWLVHYGVLSNCIHASRYQLVALTSGSIFKFIIRQIIQKVQEIKVWYRRILVGSCIFRYSTWTCSGLNWKQEHVTWILWLWLEWTFLGSYYGLLRNGLLWWWCIFLIISVEIASRSAALLMSSGSWWPVGNDGCICLRRSGSVRA